MDTNCVFDSNTKTYTCNAGNIHVTGAVALQSGENVKVTATNEFVINTGASLTSNAGNGQVGGYFVIDADSAKIQGSLLSAGGVCTGNRAYSCIEGGGGNISIVANTVDVSGEISSKGNDGYCSYYPCTIKGGDAGKIDIQASNTIGITGTFSANGGTTQGCDNYPGDGGIVDLSAGSVNIAGKLSAKGGDSTGIVSWCGGTRSGPGGIITVTANDLTLNGQVFLNSGNAANVASGWSQASHGGTLEIVAKNTMISNAIINAFGGNSSSPTDYPWGGPNSQDYGGVGGNVTVRSDKLSIGTNSINAYGGTAQGVPGGLEYGGDGGKIEITTFSSLAPIGTYYAYGGKAYINGGTAINGKSGTIIFKAGGFDSSGATFNPDAVFIPTTPPPPSQPITPISTIWEDETDKMIVPYDQVKLKFTFKNNLATTIKNIKLSFKNNILDNENRDVLKIVNGKENIDPPVEYNNPVLPGQEFYVNNLVNVAGTDNNRIINDIISTNGRIYLTESINVTIQYDTDTETGLKEVIPEISPTDNQEGGTVLSIQYPNFYTEPDLQYEDEDINYYKQGDDDFSHGECVDTNSDGICDSPPNPLVRKYAVEAAAYFGNFPDNPKDVSFNVFRYVDDKLGLDKDPAYANNDNWIVGEFDNKQDLSNIGWICIPQAYLFTSFERALGFPSREITVGEGTHKAESEKPKIIYYQNAGAEVWYNGYWNYYDPWTSQSKFKGIYINDNILSLNDILDKTPIIQYKAWYAFDKQLSKTLKNLDYQGHDFTICTKDYPLIPCTNGAGAPMDNINQWKKRAEGLEPGKSNVIIAGSPIKMLVRDNQGKLVGSTDTGIVNEIPGAKYMPPGQIGYSNKGDPGTAVELDEFISLPDDLNGKYELIVTGTGDGEYTLQFAKFDPSSEDEYSGVTTFTDNIKKDEIRRYEVSINDAGISPVLPVAIDIKPGSFPNSIKLGSEGNVPVAILSDATFDARTVNASTVTLAGATVNLKGKGTPMANIEDINNDGLLDMVVHVNTEALQLTATDTAAILEGKTVGGTPIKGTDSVRIVPP